MKKWRAVALALAGMSWAGLAQAADYRFMTGPQGGAWYPLGGALGNVIGKALPGTNIQILPGGGVRNALAIEIGKADIALGNAVSTIDGVAGRPPFKKPATKLRNVATFYAQYFQAVVVADAGIETIADLKGKAIAVGLRGDSGEQLARDALSVYGLTYDDFSDVNHLNYSDTVALFQDGHIDVFMIQTTLPSSAVMEAGTSRPARILAIADDKLAALSRINQQYLRRVIPEGTYPDQGGDIQTFGSWTHLMVSADLPDDHVYALTKAVVEARAEFGNVVQAMAGITAEQMAAPIGVAMHPGAERYYREQGLIN